MSNVKTAINTSIITSLIVSFVIIYTFANTTKQVEENSVSNVEETLPDPEPVVTTIEDRQNISESISNQRQTWTSYWFWWQSIK